MLRSVHSSRNFPAHAGELYSQNRWKSSRDSHARTWGQHGRCRHFQQPADRHEGRRSFPSPASPSKKLTALGFLLRFLPCCVLRGAVGGAKNIARPEV